MTMILATCRKSNRHHQFCGQTILAKALEASTTWPCRLVEQSDKEYQESEGHLLSTSIEGRRVNDNALRTPPSARLD
ncbi:MAG TPA: hypothetical protein PKZ67_10975 [Accumulibacter sp.]|uniref:Uncharacterized protein n=1 Tax=Candidatus Accumulibacter cognatus TaxID=2954383 RepID=A0A7D5NA55_9PROT|nr:MULTISPECIES: hypothetical protein [Candidatus Accumulibacter]MCC2867921.1 hypothetical protein [Candidatus Accumulibacter phosphatis]MBL8401475.1 hypothetical protein [Accumulibacter sp.]MBN8518796.1 hypothetical protein [Accumulibacter sp.]MBO3711977.1 hypothetical protein [Accumulibacter sp.]MCM8577863.1 hypothetical protein [Accumulibacter sp.]